MMQGSLAERLRVLRAQRGLTLIEAAERTGVGRDTLSNLERGRSHPVMPTLAKIAEGYGVPVEELAEAELREHAKDLPIALAILATDSARRCAREGQRLQQHLSSLTNAIPVSANPFFEKHFALDVIYKELAYRGGVPEELREELEDAKEQLDKIAATISSHTNQLMRPRAEDGTREWFVERRRREGGRQDDRGRREDTA